MIVIIKSLTWLTGKGFWGAGGHSEREETTGGPSTKWDIEPKVPLEPPERIALGLILAEDQFMVRTRLRLNDPVAIPNKVYYDY